MKTLIISLLVLLASCEENIRLSETDTPENKYYSKEIFPPHYADFYGKWKGISVTGGIAGINKKPDFDFLVVEKIGKYAIIKNDKEIESGKITVEVFDDKSHLLQVQFIPDSTISSSNFASLFHQYVELAEPNTLNLMSSCCDGFNYHFEGVK